MNVLYWNNKQNVCLVEQLLEQDQIVLASGDTVLGLLGQVSQASYDRLNGIKKRYGKPYLLLIASADKLALFIDQPMTESIKQLVTYGWPGPLTLIFKARADLPDFMKHANGTIALRVPDHAGLQTVLQACDGLFSTSANVHTACVPAQLLQVDQSILEHVAAVCVDQSDQCYDHLPSTILDCSGDAIGVVRTGAGMSEQIKKIIA